MKRYFAVLMTILMILIVPPVNAVGENIILNHDFIADVSGWTARNGAEITWESEGAQGSTGCAKIKLVGNLSAISQENLHLIPGETYQISFYIRTESGNSTASLIWHFSQGGYQFLITNTAINGNWKKVSLKYTFDGKNHLDETVDGRGKMEIRVADGKQSLVHYLDNVQIIPQSGVKIEEEKPEPIPVEKEVSDLKFDDVQGHWAEPVLTNLYRNRFINGVGNNRFDPEKCLTRAEFVEMMILALRLEQKQYAGCVNDVTDGDWYAPSIQTAYDLGSIGGPLTLGGYFWPNQEITREEAAYIIAHIAGLKSVTKQEPKQPADLEDISEWAKQSVFQAAEAGWLYGYPDGRFYPKRLITRAEAAVLANRIAEHGMQTMVFVDGEKGNDQNKGVFEAPVKTMAAAQKLVRSINGSMRSNIYVYIKSGEYPFEQTLALSQEDSGTNGYHIIYSGYGGQTVFSGGKTFTGGWELHDSQLGIYKAHVGKNINTRQMFVNGVRATRARSEGGLSDVTYDNGEIGHTTTDTFLADYKNVKDLEMVYYRAWTNPRCGVDHIEVNDDIATIYLDQPAWKNNRNKGGQISLATGPAYYENAYELIDKQGEWYYDGADGYLYYLPREFEDLQTAKIVLPVLEKLVTMQGTVDEPIHNISFEQITFAYTTWLKPSTTAGLVESQNCHLGGKLPDSAVLLNNGKYVDFSRCTFTKLGITGLKMVGAVQDCDVTANEFYDISGSAVSLGEPAFRDSTVYNPQDEKYMIRNCSITNNYIHHVAVEYKAAAGLSTGFPKDTVVSHNEIFDVPYSGMHLGCGWEEIDTSATEHFICEKNYVHKVMSDEVYDGAAIYNLGPTGGTEEEPNFIRENYIEDVRNLYGALYPDMGSSGIAVEENVVDLSMNKSWTALSSLHGEIPARWLHINSSLPELYIKNNYSTTPNVSLKNPNVKFEEAHLYENADWPERAEEIVEKAGIEPEYIDLFQEVPDVSITAESGYDMQTGDEFEIGIEAVGRKKTQVSIPKENIFITSRDERIATVTDEGTVRAGETGKTYIDVQVVTGDMVHEFTVEVRINDSVDDLKLDRETYTIIKNAKATIYPKVTSMFGMELSTNGVSYSIADENIATVTPMGIIEAKNEGITELKARIEVDGVTHEKTAIIEVIDVGAGMPAEEEGYDFGKEISDLTAWAVDNSSTKEQLDNGMKLELPSGLARYTKRMFLDELITFDMQINAESGWPSLVLRATEAPYNTGDCYMITFRNGQIELQRFNSGNRTVIFGKVSGFQSLVCDQIPFDYRYGQRYTIQAGARNVENGVEITLNIDGVSVFKYIDTDEKCLKNSGYVGFYVRAGNIELYPPMKEGAK